MPTTNDAKHYAQYYGRNAEHLRPWEPLHAPNIDREDFWASLLPIYRDEYLAGAGLRLAMRLQEDPGGLLIGMCHLMQVQRGATQSCVIGYSVDVNQQGKGYMSEALRATVAYAFETFGLHRIQATYMPTNIRSARILHKLGFLVEGYLRDYLFIDGAWRDHLLVGLVNPSHASLSSLQMPPT